MKFVKKVFDGISGSRRAGRKGITPVIAIVLLLMMTVAAAGMAYVWIMSIQGDIAQDTAEDLADIQDEKNTRLEIVTVRNDSNGKIELTFKNAGSYVFSASNAEQIKLYIDGVSIDLLSSTCGTDIKGRGTTCTLDGAITEANYPSVVGSDGAVEIRIEPPFGSGDIHICSIPDLGTHKTC